MPSNPPFSLDTLASPMQAELASQLCLLAPAHYQGLIPHMTRMMHAVTTVSSPLDPPWDFSPCYPTIDTPPPHPLRK